MHNHSSVSTLRRPAAAILGASTLLALAALAHHPGGMVPPATAHDGLVQIDALAGPLQAMHGAMIALYVLLAGCHAVFAGLLGARRPPVLLAMTAYLAGCGLICGAALLDGFVTPQLAHLYVLAPEPRALQVNVTLAAISVGIQGADESGLAFHVPRPGRVWLGAGDRRTAAPRPGHACRGGRRAAGVLHVVECDPDRPIQPGGAVRAASRLACRHGLDVVRKKSSPQAASRSCHGALELRFVQRQHAGAAFDDGGAQARRLG